MTQQQLITEIQHLRWMQTNTICNKCKRELALRIERREQHLKDRIKFDYLIMDLQSQGIEVKVVKRFENNQSQGME